MVESTRGLLDTSVVIDHDIVDPASLPDESAIAAVTLAELAAGPHATGDDGERARRQDRLQWAAVSAMRRAPQLGQKPPAVSLEGDSSRAGHDRPSCHPSSGILAVNQFVLARVGLNRNPGGATDAQKA